MDNGSHQTDWYLRAAELRRRAELAATAEEKRKWLLLASSCDDMLKLFAINQQNPSPT